MATTAHSKTFCFRTNWKRRLLKLILIALLLLLGVIFAVKVHKKLTKLSHQYDSLHMFHSDLRQRYSSEITHLNSQFDTLKTQIELQNRRESAHALELKSIQVRYQGEIDALKLIVQQYQANVRELSEKNIELTYNLHFLEVQTSETLRELKFKLDKVTDSASFKKQMETLFEEFLKKEIYDLLQIKSVPNNQEGFSQKETKILPESKIHDAHVIYFEDPFEVVEAGIKNELFIMREDKTSETQDSVKTEHFQSDEDHDRRDTSYRFTHKGLKDPIIINDVNFSDPFDTEEDEGEVKTEHSGSHKFRDWIDTSYRFTKEKFEAVKDYVNENGPKIAEEVQRVSKRKAKEVNEYVTETIPKVSKKIKDLGEKTKEITEKVGTNVKKQAEKFAGQAKKLTDSIYNMMRP